MDRLMKKLQSVTLLVATMLLAACSQKEAEPAPMEFEPYEQKAEVSIPDNDGEWIESLNLCVDVPVGDGEAQANAIKGIMEIISKSNVAKTLGAPTGNTLKEVVDNYAQTLKNNFKAIFDKTRAADNYPESELNLVIRCTYQNEACVVMFVADGRDGVIDVSRQYEGVIRLSDGHLMTDAEIANISKEQLMELARKYADEAQDVDIEEEGEYNISLGHQALLFHPNQYFLDEYAIPMEAVEGYLTEEAKALLTAKELVGTKTAQPAESAKGDLTMYDVHGPVKELQLITDYSKVIYTFDTNGQLMAEKHEMDGNVLDDKLFYDRTNRDAQGRGVERFRESNVKEINTFDEAGRLVKQEYWLGGRLEWRNVNYYDSLGKLYKTNQKATVSSIYYTTITTKFYDDRGFVYDDHGNWTERTCQKSGDDPKRVITYYDEDEQKSEPIAETKTDESKTYEPGRGDLGAYDLRGPVKSVKYDEWSAAFNEQGQLTHENGQPLKSIFPGGVKRDKNGRLTECNADGFGSRYYTYNDKGLPTEIAEDGGGRTITYDADGYVKTESMALAPEMGDEEGETEIIKVTYTIIEKDSYGNWTKRKDQDGNVTKRAITYF